MIARRVRRLLFYVAGIASVVAFLAFLGAVWTGPSTDLSNKLGGTGALCLVTAITAALVGGLILAGET